MDYLVQFRFTMSHLYIKEKFLKEKIEIIKNGLCLLGEQYLWELS